MFAVVSGSVAAVAPPFVLLTDGVPSFVTGFTTAVTFDVLGPALRLNVAFDAAAVAFDVGILCFLSPFPAWCRCSGPVIVGLKRSVVSGSSGYQLLTSLVLKIGINELIDPCQGLIHVVKQLLL